MKPIAEIGEIYTNFLGINNIDDIHKFSSNRGTYLQLAINCDVDDTGQLRRRGGLQQRISGASHSAWSNPSQTICLLVKDGKLCRLEKDFVTLTIIGDISSDARVSFVEVWDKIFYSNSSIIGYYKDGTMNSLPSINQAFKHPMKPGHLLEWFNGRLYSAQGNVIYFSDPMVPMVWDERKNFIPLPGYITMMKAVADGLYVACLDGGTMFLAGKDPSEFQYINITDSHAYLYSGVTVYGEDLGEAGQQALGKAIFWTCAEGVFRALAGGRVKNVTGDAYSPVESDIQMGAALYREDLDYNQYIFVYNFEQNNEGQINIPHPTVSGVGTIS